MAAADRHGNEPSSTIFGRLFLDQQCNYELAPKNYVQWSEF